MPSRKTKETDTLKEKKVNTSNVSKNTKAKSSAVSKTKKSTVKKETSAKKNTNPTKKVSAKTTKKSSSKSTKKSTKVAAKKVTTTTPKRTSKKTSKIDILEYYDLPYRYNQTIVKILAQTPNTMFVYWDISDEDRNNYISKYGQNFFETTRPVLIVHNDTMNYAFEVPINDFANSWYLHLNDSKCTYTIELGRRPISDQVHIPNNYLYVSSSNKLETPNDHILFEKSTGSVFFKDIKTNSVTQKDIGTLAFIKRIGGIYNIYEMYQKIYQKEDVEEFNDFLNNPSSNNPSSTFK